MYAPSMYQNRKNWGYITSVVRMERDAVCTEKIGYESAMCIPRRARKVQEKDRSKSRHRDLADHQRRIHRERAG